MYNSEFERMCCILDGYAAILKAHKKDLLLTLDARYCLAEIDSYTYLKTIPESLHNLATEPSKAHQIVIYIREALNSLDSIQKNVGSLEALLKQEVSRKLQSDTPALQFAESVISRTIELAGDDSQFSAFSYF